MCNNALKCTRRFTLYYRQVIKFKQLKGLKMSNISFKFVQNPKITTVTLKPPMQH
jgi:hypothetical protein